MLRMATDNPGWGDTRIQGALKNLGHGVARSTVAKVLKANGIPARAGPPVLLADVPTGPLGRDRGGGLLHDRSLDASGAGGLLHAVCDRSPEPAGPRGGLAPDPGCVVHGPGGAPPHRRG